VPLIERVLDIARHQRGLTHASFKGEHRGRQLDEDGDGWRGGGKDDADARLAQIHSFFIPSPKRTTLKLVVVIYLSIKMSKLSIPKIMLDDVIALPPLAGL